MALILGWLGLVPFIASFMATLHDSALLGLYAPFVFVLYSGAILSFLSGIFWGRVINDPKIANRVSLLAWSNFFCLLAFVSMLLTQLLITVSIASLALGYWLILKVERELLTEDCEPNYWAMRKTISYIVMALHCILLVCLVFK